MPLVGDWSIAIGILLYCILRYDYIELKMEAEFKGTGHDFCLSEKPIYHLQKQGHIHIFQNKKQNPHKFAEMMKKTSVLVSFILEGTLTAFLIP